MPEVTVTHEPLTYERSAPRSYFRDVALAANGNGEARARLDAHGKEMRVEIPRREQRAAEAAARNGIELRTNPSRLDGQGGFGSPPLWLIDDAATAARPGRVLSALMPSFPLPSGVSEVNVPRLTTGAHAQPVVDLGAVTERDIADAAVTSPVVTIAGQVDVPLQLLEQSPPGAYLDHAVFRDLSASQGFQLERMLINGSGVNGQLLGLLNVPSGVGLANAVAYSDATPSGAEIFPFFGQVVGQIGDARLMPPEIWLMRTAREAWLLTAEDGNGMPLSPPGQMASPLVPYLFDDSRPSPGASLITYPIYRDDAIPANMGVGANQDAVICCRPSDMMLLESVPRTTVMLEVLSGTMQARLQLHAYAAALVARYPTGIGTLTGLGMIVQPGY